MWGLWSIKLHRLLVSWWGHAVVQLVEALRYKPQRLWVQFLTVSLEFFIEKKWVVLIILIITEIDVTSKQYILYFFFSCTKLHYGPTVTSQLFWLAPLSDEILDVVTSKSSRPHYGSGVDSASNRNEYHEYFLCGKGGRCVGLTTLPPSRADCLEIWKPQPPGTLRACPGL
jgi:hypothetical protein